MAKYASQVNIGVTATTGPARKALKDVATEAVKADKQIEAAGADVRTDKAESEFGQLEKQIAQTVRTLYKLKGELGKGVDSGATVKSLSASIDKIRGQVSPDAPAASSKFLEAEGKIDSMFGNRSALKKGTELLVGAGAVGGIALLTSAFASATSKAKELSAAIASGEMTTAEATDQLVRSIPILGSLAGSVSDVIDLWTGQTAALALMEKEAKGLAAIHQAVDSLRELRIQIQGLATDRRIGRENQREIMDAEDRGASPAAIDFIQAKQDTAGDWRDIDKERDKRIKEATDKADAAMKSVGSEFWGPITDELSTTLAAIERDRVEQLRGVFDDGNTQLERIAKKDFRDKVGKSVKGMMGSIAGLADLPVVQGLAGIGANLAGAGGDGKEKVDSFAKEIGNLDRQLKIEMAGGDERDRRNAEINLRDDLTDAQKQELIQKNDAIDAEKEANATRKKIQDDAMSARANPELMLAGSAAAQRLAMVQSGKLVDAQNPALIEAKKANGYLEKIAAQTAPAGTESLN
jgi:hypothetical protein